MGDGCGAPPTSRGSFLAGVGDGRPRLDPFRNDLALETTLGEDVVDVNGARAAGTSSTFCLFGGRGGNAAGSYAGAFIRFDPPSFAWDREVRLVLLDTPEMDEIPDTVEDTDSDDPRLVACSDGLLGGRLGACSVSVRGGRPGDAAVFRRGGKAGDSSVFVLGGRLGTCSEGFREGRDGREGRLGVFDFIDGSGLNSSICGAGSTAG